MITIKGKIYCTKFSHFPSFSTVPQKFFCEYLIKLHIMALLKCFKRKPPWKFPVFIGWDLRKFSPANLSRLWYVIICMHAGTLNYYTILHTNVHTHTRTYTQTYTHVHMHTHTHIHTHLHTCTHTRTYTHVHTHTRTHTQWHKDMYLLTQCTHNCFPFTIQNVAYSNFKYTCITIFCYLLAW